MDAIKLIDDLVMEIDEATGYSSAVVSVRVIGAVISTLIRKDILTREDAYEGVAFSRFCPLAVASLLP